jgi:predicted DNA-binding transcriptional regulator AlpA
MTIANHERLWTMEQLTNQLAISKQQFYRSRKRLEAEDGLPKPAHGRGKSARWDPLAIKQWLADKRANSPSQHQDSTDSLLTQTDQTLASRLEALTLRERKGKNRK